MFLLLSDELLGPYANLGKPSFSLDEIWLTLHVINVNAQGMSGHLTVQTGTQPPKGMGVFFSIANWQTTGHSRSRSIIGWHCADV